MYEFLKYIGFDEIHQMGESATTVSRIMKNLSHTFNSLLIITIFWLSPSLGFAENCSDVACLEARLQNNPVRKVSFWSDLRMRPIDRRVVAAPDELIQFISDDNQLYGYPPGVRSADTDHSFIGLVQMALRGLPPKVLQLLDDKLAGIALVHELGTSGYTDKVFDSDDKAVGGFIILDVDRLNQNANEWASYRDSTAFVTNKQYSLRTVIAEDIDDTVLSTIQFLVLHELAHVYSIGETLHPDWASEPASVQLEEFRFARLSWLNSADDSSYASLFDGMFSLRGQIAYYQEKALPASKISTVFNRIQHSNFNSLYSTTSLWEDFAESFAIYVHYTMMKKPYYSEYLVNGERQATITPCFQGRCADKAQILESLFN
jgi:hypothetical protein